MRVLLCNPRGFYTGANMAIDCVDTVLKLKGAPVYAYHEIVHNRHVVQSFVDRGVTFVDSVDDVPDGTTLTYSRSSPTSANATGYGAITEERYVTSKDVHFELPAPLRVPASR